MLIPSNIRIRRCGMSANETAIYQSTYDIEANNYGPSCNLQQWAKPILYGKLN